MLVPHMTRQRHFKILSVLYFFYKQADKKISEVSGLHYRFSKGPKAYGIKQKLPSLLQTLFIPFPFGFPKAAFSNAFFFFFFHLILFSQLQFHEHLSQTPKRLWREGQDYPNVARLYILPCARPGTLCLEKDLLLYDFLKCFAGDFCKYNKDCNQSYNSHSSLFVFTITLSRYKGKF